MGRQANPQRRGELLAQIVEVLGKESLATVSLRTLASKLGVSTYTLMYQFGSRAGLVDAVLSESVATRRSIIGDYEAKPPAVRDDAWMHASIIEGFRQSISPVHARGIRFQFEAGVVERIDSDMGTRVSGAYKAWAESAIEWIHRQGIEGPLADDLAYWLVDSLFGIHFGHLLSGDTARSMRICEIVADSFISRVSSLRPPASE